MPSLCLGEQLSFPSTPCQNLNVSEFIWAKHRFKVVTTWDDQALVWDSVFMGRFTSTLSHTAIRAVKSAMLFYHHPVILLKLSFFSHFEKILLCGPSCLECSSSCYLAAVMTASFFFFLCSCPLCPLCWSHIVLLWVGWYLQPGYAYMQSCPLDDPLSFCSVSLFLHCDAL